MTATTMTKTDDEDTMADTMGDLLSQYDEFEDVRA